MAVLKQTSPTAWPTAPKPAPSSTVPSASTRSAVGTGSDQPEAPCSRVMRRLHNPARRLRQRTTARSPSAARSDQRGDENGDEIAGQAEAVHAAAGQCRVQE